MLQCTALTRLPAARAPLWRLQVKVLSGGEKARLALAKFMCTQVRGMRQQLHTAA
jgi:ATPase subunit of ABC transporter with duplicated ATPase domains